LPSQKVIPGFRISSLDFRHSGILGFRVSGILAFRSTPFTKGKNNFSFLEMLDITGRVIRLMEIKHKGRINKVVEELEVTWPTNLQQEIVEGMKTAEKEVLKTM